MRTCPPDCRLLSGDVGNGVPHRSGLHSNLFSTRLLCAGLGLVLSLLATTRGATRFEDVESTVVPALPAGWATTNTPQWVAASNVTYDTGRDVGSNVFSVALAAGVADSGWLTAGPFGVSTNFAVDGFVRLESLGAGGTAHLEVALASGSGAPPAAGDYVRQGERIELPAGGEWLHFCRAVYEEGQISNSWAGEASVYVGFRLHADTNATVSLDNVLVGDAFHAGNIEAFFSGVLDARWHAKALNSSNNWAEHAVNASGSEAGSGSIRFDTSILDDAEKARVSPRNAIFHAGRENVIVKFKSYNQWSSQDDWFQVVLSTNDWATSVNVGDPLPRYVNTAGSWVNRAVTNYIPGLRHADSVRLGLLGIAAMPFASGRPVVADDLQFRFFTDVVLGDVHQYADALALHQLDRVTYTDASVYTGLEVDLRPPSAISNVTCDLHYWIDGGSTNKVAMTKVPSTDVYVAQIASTPFEAGQVVSNFVHCTFDSDEGTNEFRTTEITSFTVESLGTVWINEVCPTNDADRQFLELAAPAARAVTNWRVEVVNLSTSAAPTVTNVTTVFSDDDNGYGFWVMGGSDVPGRDADLGFTLPEAGGVRLFNSAGIEEHSFAYGVLTNCPGYNATVTSTDGVSYGLAGYARSDESAWPQCYTNFTPVAFTNPTAGETNPGQGFLVPKSVRVSVQHYDASGTNVGYAASRIEVKYHGGSVWHEETANSNGFVAATNILTGFHDTDTVPVSIVSAAWGYAPSTTNLVAQVGTGTVNAAVNVLLPGPAFDDFDGDAFKPFWQVKGLGGGAADWVHRSDEGVGHSGGAIYDGESTAFGKASTYLYAVNGVPAAGAKSVIVELDIENRRIFSPWMDTVRFTLASNNTFAAGSILKQFPEINHWDDTYSSGQWVTRRFRWNTTNKLDGLSHVWTGLLGKPSGSGSPIRCDNLEVAVGGNLSLSDLETAPTVFRTGASPWVRVRMLPWGDTVTNVLPRLHYRRDGGSWIETDMLNSGEVLTDGITLTNAVVVSNMIPNLVADETIEYYVSATFGGTSTNFSTVYHPDNAVLDAASGIEVITDGYKPEPRSTVVKGIPQVWINEIAYDQAGGNDNFIELAGRAGLSLANYTVTVIDDGGTNRGIYPLGPAAALTNGSAGACKFYVLGGTSVDAAKRDMLLSSTPLPASGGIALLDAMGEHVDAVSYGANGNTLTEYTYVGEANQSHTHVYTTGEGPVANGAFALPWAADGRLTPAEANDGQDLIDDRPPVLRGAAWVDPTPESMATNAIRLEAGGASDFSIPVTYAFARTGHTHTNTPAEGRSHTDSHELQENTSYDYRIHFSDSQGNTLLSSNRSTCTWIRNAAPVTFHDPTPTSVVVRTAGLPNLTNGNSGVVFSRDGGVETIDTNNASEAVFTGLGANTWYEYTAQARNGDGIYSDESARSTNCTLSLVPPAPTVTATGIRRMAVTVNEHADNPSYTKYAVAYTNPTQPGVLTYVCPDGSTTNALGEACWLSSWPVVVELDGLTDISYAFKSRSRNQAGVLSEWGPESNLAFYIAADIVRAEQTTIGDGVVEIDVKLENYQTTNAWVSVLFSNALTGAAGFTNAWLDANAAASFGSVTVSNTHIYSNQHYQVLGVEFGDDGTNTVKLKWQTKNPSNSVDLSSFFGETLLSVTPLSTGATVRATGDSTNMIVDNAKLLGRLDSLDASPTNADTLEYEITWYGNAYGFTADDIRVVMGGTATNTGVTLLPAADGLNVYTAALTGVTGDGWIGIAVDADVCTDRAGNTNVALGPASNVVDNTEPLGTMTALAPRLTNATSLWYRIEFTNGPVYGLTVDDLNVFGTGSATSAGKELVPDGGGLNVYTAILSGVSGDGWLGVTLNEGACTDKAGNGNGNEGLAASNLVDNTPPNRRSFTPAFLTPTNGTELSFSFEFDSPVRGLSFDDLRFIGRLSHVSHEGGELLPALPPGELTNKFEVTLWGVRGDGNYSIAIDKGACMDEAGNENTYVGGSLYAVDQTEPYGTIANLSASPTNASTIEFSIMFTQDWHFDYYRVYGFRTGDVTVVTNGVTYTGFSLLPVADDVADFTATFTGVDGDGWIGIAVDGGVCRDQAGNTNVPLGLATNVIDNTRPAGTITALTTEITNASSLWYRLDFADNQINGLTSNDVSVSGTVSHEAVELLPAGDGFNVYTAKVNGIEGDGWLVVEVGAAVCTDLAGNDNFALGRASNRVDRVAPLPTGAAVINSNALYAVVSRWNPYVSIQWPPFLSVEQGVTNPYSGEYYYGLSDTVGTTNAPSTMATNAVITNVPAGVVTGYVWAVDGLGNVGVTEDDIEVCYDAAAFVLTVGGTNGADSVDMTAGVEQEVTIKAIYDRSDPASLAVDYTGVVDLVFSGPLPSPAGDQPSARDMGGSSVVFGNDTTSRFTRGVATCNITLTRAETNRLNVADGVTRAVGDTWDYGLGTIVTPAAVSQYVVALPGTNFVTAGATGQIDISACDVFGNTDTNYTGVKQVVCTGASPSPGGGHEPTFGGEVLGPPVAVSFDVGASREDLVLYAAGEASLIVSNSSDMLWGSVTATVGHAAYAEADWSPEPMSSVMISNPLALFGAKSLDLYGNVHTEDAAGSAQMFAVRGSSTNIVTTNLASGVATFSSVAFGEAGSRRLNVVIAKSSATNSTPYAVVRVYTDDPQSARMLDFKVLPDGLRLSFTNPELSVDHTLLWTTNLIDTNSWTTNGLAPNFQLETNSWQSDEEIWRVRLPNPDPGGPGYYKIQTR